MGKQQEQEKRGEWLRDQAETLEQVARVVGEKYRPEMEKEAEKLRREGREIERERTGAHK